MYYFLNTTGMTHLKIYLFFFCSKKMILRFDIKKGSCVTSRPLRTLNYRFETEQFNLLLHLPECCALLFITNLQMNPAANLKCRN